MFTKGFKRTALAGVSMSTILFIGSCSAGSISEFVTMQDDSNKTEAKESKKTSVVVPARSGEPHTSGSFWQELPEGGKILCVWATTPTSISAGGLSCDWRTVNEKVHRSGGNASEWTKADK